MHSAMFWIHLNSLEGDLISAELNPLPCLDRAHFVAPHFDARANLVADFPRTCEALVVCATERGRIWKTPVQSLGHARKNRTTLGGALVADSDYVGEQFARFENIEYGLSLILRNIDPDLAHCFDGQRVERSRFEPGAVCFKQIDTDLVEKRFRHLAASAVMNTDE